MRAGLSGGSVAKLCKNLWLATMVPPKNVKSPFFCQKARMKTSISGQIPQNKQSRIADGWVSRNKFVTLVQTWVQVIKTACWLLPSPLQIN